MIIPNQESYKKVIFLWNNLYNTKEWRSLTIQDSHLSPWAGTVVYHRDSYTKTYTLYKAPTLPGKCSGTSAAIKAH